MFDFPGNENDVLCGTEGVDSKHKEALVFLPLFLSLIFYPYFFNFVILLLHFQNKDRVYLYFVMSVHLIKTSFPM
jgi:hypothetical protein